MYLKNVNLILVRFTTNLKGKGIEYSNNQIKDTNIEQRSGMYLL